MNTAARTRPTGLLPVRGPGLGWLPPVLRRRVFWRTVWRFVWAGPLIGGLPYVWMVVTVPFAYGIGVLPAAMAGLLFGSWYHGQPGRVPTWPWRAAVGALAGAGAAFGIGLITMLGRQSLDGFTMALVAVHGVPAAVVLALLQKPERPAA